MQERKNYIVGIGASAGGLDAVQKLFTHIPANTNMAFVVVQHLSSDYKSLMPELLAKHTEMKIYTVENNMSIKPNCLYLNPQNKNIGIKDDKFVLLTKAPKNYLNLPIDILFHTLGETYSEKSIGVVLSGTGSDGSRGIKTIKESGGMVLIQDPESAQFDGMPNSAILTNMADFVLSPRKMAEKIVQITNSRLQLNGLKDDIEKEKYFFDILSLIQKSNGINFKYYKINTLLRRIQKRMTLHNVVRIGEYFEYLKKDTNEQIALGQEFLIGVTSFFRDEDAFKVFKNEVVPSICNNNKSHTIRIWVPGCSSGEEAYSIAMLFEDYITTNNLDVTYKIFATDVDKNALYTGSIGSYSINNFEQIDQKYLDAFFIKKGGFIQIAKKIREKIVFSYHDITNDPPFIKMDLVSCRNMLIYLSSNTQKKVLASFQYGLNVYGYLFLGSSESLGHLNKRFRVIDAKHKIFQNLDSDKKLPADIYRDKSLPTSISIPRPYVKKNSVKSENVLSNEAWFYKYLSKKHSPVSVFVDENFSVLFMLGDFRKWFNHSDGTFSNSLLNLVNTELAVIIRNSIRKISQKEKGVCIKNMIYDLGEEKVTTDLFIEQTQGINENEPVYLIQFRVSETLVPTHEISLSPKEVSDITRQRIEDLEGRLQEKSIELHNVLKELETSNEELQSSNEELMSSNEELQSSNEELQSLNEELYTVNAEFQEKNKELTDLNNDINNLINSTDIGTLFLDTKLRIRKYTPALKRLFKLEESDIGRSIASFASEFSDEIRKSIISDSKKALEVCQIFEKQIFDRYGNCYIKRISPFITDQHDVGGVVLTFVDINDIKRKEEELKQKTNELSEAQKIAKLGNWTLNIETNEVTWSEELYRMMGFDPQLPPPSLDEQEKIFTPVCWKRLSEAIEKTIREGTYYELELETIKKDGSTGWIWARGYASKNSDGEIKYLHGVAQDIFLRKQLNEKLKREQRFANKIAELSPTGIFIYDLEKNTADYLNDQCQHIMGFTKSEFKAMSVDEFMSLIHPDDLNNVQLTMQKVTSGDEYCSVNYRLRHKNGKWVWCYAVNSPFNIDEYGKVKSFISVFIDVTEQKHIEAELNEAIKQANSANVYKNQFLANMSHEIRTPMNGLVGFASLLRDDEIDRETKNAYVDIIESSSQQLLTLIDDIIDVSKLETGELKVVMGSCNLNKLFNELETTYNELKLHKKKDDVLIKAYIPECDEDVVIETDSARLKQILMNLLSNALKFTNKGSIEFGFSLLNDKVIFSVSDTGIGMSKDKLDLIFERFHQLEKPDNANYEGTGLGLAISNGIVQLLGGKFSVKSEVGKGSTFVFELPG